MPRQQLCQAVLYSYHRAIATPMTLSMSNHVHTSGCACRLAKGYVLWAQNVCVSSSVLTATTQCQAEQDFDGLAPNNSICRMTAGYSHKDYQYFFCCTRSMLILPCIPSMDDEPFASM